MFRPLRSIRPTVPAATALLATALLATATTGCTSAPPPSDTGVAAPLAATVGRTRGAVQAADGSGAALRALSFGDTVLKGETVVTEAGERAELHMIDGGTIRLGSEAALVMQEARPAGAEGAALLRLRLTAGAMELETGRGTGFAEGEVIVDTPVATLDIARTARDRITGTRLFALPGPDNEGYGLLLTKGGPVIVENQAGTTTLDAQGEGVSLSDPAAAHGPTDQWPQERINKAFQSVRVHP